MRLRSLATLAIGLSLCPAAASATELRVLSSWNENYPPRPKLLEVFLKNVETASKGEITFKISGPETVPPFEQPQPVSTGASAASLLLMNATLNSWSRFIWTSNTVSSSRFVIDVF